MIKKAVSFSGKTIRCLVAILIFLQFSSPSLYANSFNLPQPGLLINLSGEFAPTLFRGLIIDPKHPLQFDFIVDQGDEKLEGAQLTSETQRMVNYFLATLTIPQEDLWVNLSPAEKDRIIPDTLIKTELGRDLLAQDYMLKQIASSLIYPESEIGERFWESVYEKKYNVGAGLRARPNNMGTHGGAPVQDLDIDSDLLSRVWIVPEKAVVFEKENTVYIKNVSLKVMLEADYLNSKVIKWQSDNENSPKENSVARLPRAQASDVTLSLLRENIIPEIEKEVNGGKHFAKLRQIVYAMVLAQWYKDVLRDSVLNIAYADQSKVAGIDLSKQENRDLIYSRYMEAYQKGIFDYIKEEFDPVSGEIIPKKYFAGGFQSEEIPRYATDPDVIAPMEKAMIARVDLDPVGLARSEFPLESYDQWNDLDRPKAMAEEIRGLMTSSIQFDRDKVRNFVEKYSVQLESQPLYPVQGAWPVLKAITLLEAGEEQALVETIQEIYANDFPLLADKILLMHGGFFEGWLLKNVPDLNGRRIYNVAAEIYPAEGGLGEVEQNKIKGENVLGADSVAICPGYTHRSNGTLRDYNNPQETGVRIIDEDFDRFDVVVGHLDGQTNRNVNVKVMYGKDLNGADVYLLRDIQTDGFSFYTKVLYQYGAVQNPVTKEESMAFLNMAAATLIQRLETKRKREKMEAWKSAIVHVNDGQYSPLQAVTLSLMGDDEVIKDIFWVDTTHTFLNRGSNGKDWGVNFLLKHMMKITNKYIAAFVPFGKNIIDHTSGGINLAHLATAVSDKHRRFAVDQDFHVPGIVAVTNGAMPEKLAGIYREEFLKLKKEGKINSDADYERLTAEENRLTKVRCKERFNQSRIKTVSGRDVDVDIDRPMVGYARRLVKEKAGSERAFAEANIWEMVKMGYNVVLMGRYQGQDASEALTQHFLNIERAIQHEKESNPSAYPGAFFFVNDFSPTEKATFLASVDLMIQDSDENTGAAEYSEEHPAGAYIGTGTFREGVIADQGIPLRATASGNGEWVFANPGEGNTIMPQQDTSESWRETVYKPLMNLWNEDREGFYAGAALTSRLIRIMKSEITSAEYLRQYEKGIEHQKTMEQYDAVILEQIKSSLAHDGQGEVDDILHKGRNGVGEFKFKIMGKDPVPAREKGISGFIEYMRQLEEEYGYNALFEHLMNGHYASYLIALFHGLEASNFLQEWWQTVANDRQVSLAVNQSRFETFIGALVTKLEETKTGDLVPVLASTADKASLSADQRYGGIDARYINVIRKGHLEDNWVDEQEMIDVLQKVQGFKGTIVTMTLPISLSVILNL